MRLVIGLGIIATVTGAVGAAYGGAPRLEPATQGGTDSVLIAAAGDLVCGTETPEDIPCVSLATAELVRQLKPHALLLLGDLQYEKGSLTDFRSRYDAEFGEFKSITYPVPGNHEYFTPRASGYFDYFNGVGVDSGRAGKRSGGYYSFNLGAWHIVALNSNCRDIGGCTARSAQAAWLREDLKANRAKCTLAFSHSPRFSSGIHGSDLLMRDLFQILYDGGVDVMVSGHDHGYERFRRMNSMGDADEQRGIRVFIAGTGGKGLARMDRERPNSEKQGLSIGLLTMVLRPESYSWKFAAALPNVPFEDSGEGKCHE